MATDPFRLLQRTAGRFARPPGIILGGYPSTNVGAIRSLFQEGVPTVTIDARPRQASFYSRHTIGLLCPDPGTDETSYVSFLLRVGQAVGQRSVLLPTGDTETLAILRHRQELSNLFAFSSCDYPIIHALINKTQLSGLLDKHQIKHPRTVPITEGTDSISLSETLRYPCILKPVYPTVFRRDFPTKAFVASTPKEFRASYHKAAAKRHPMVVQEIIPGDATAMFGMNAYYDRTSQPHGTFVYRRNREWPPSFGNGCYIDTAKDPGIEHLLSPLLSSLGFYGIVDAEFKRDPRDGSLNLIEINPRIWMQVSLPTRFGCNLPYLAYLDALGFDLPNAPRVPHPCSWIYGYEDVKAALTSIKRGDLTFGRWLASYHLDTEYATFSVDDPLPCIIHGAQHVRRFLAPSWTRQVRSGGIGSEI